MAMQYGGWYDNPATGRNQRWWNGVWTDGEEPGGGSSGGSSGGGESRPTGQTIPAFKFDYEAAEAEALKQLEPYYKQKLAEANGDVELAKARIKEDYDRGIRQNAEDQETALTADSRTAQEEQEAVTDDLNRRGMLVGEIQPGETSSKAPISPYAQNKVYNPLAQKQEARRMAIQRAIERSNESLGITKNRAIQDQEIAQPRFERALQQEKLDKARFDLVPYYKDKAYTKYQGSFNPYIQGDQL